MRNLHRQVFPTESCVYYLHYTPVGDFACLSSNVAA